MTKGKLIAIYGINNLGKTLQAKMLVKKLEENGLQSEYYKVPYYQEIPTGNIINNYLREGNTYSLNAREAQIIYAFNRFQFQSTIIEKLSKGITVILEDYTGTGIAWGVGAGVDKKFLLEINSCLLQPDYAILFDGNRFVESIEEIHKHENDYQLIDNVRKIHLQLAEEFDWYKINANQSIEDIHKQIWDFLYEKIGNKKTL